jgi:2-dehydro-3-deoxygalactonokinase
MTIHPLGREGAFVAVDWGTSSFRAWLMSADGTPLVESRSGEGMQHCAGTGFEPVLRAHLAKLGASDALPVLICGMAGARQGWMEAPYLRTPTLLQALHEGAVRVRAAGDIRILPGVAQADPQRPDVMRGEETQLLGVTEAGFTGLACMPGTHSKWVQVDDGRIVGFTTCMTGELFAVLSRNSILAHAVDADAAPAVDGAAFGAGLAAALAEPDELTAALFRLRAAQLLGFEQRADGASRLSGLLIGVEVAAALRRHGRQAPVRLIASGGLGRLYEAALAHAGFEVTVLDAEQASRLGLSKAAIQLWGR